MPSRYFWTRTPYEIHELVIGLAARADRQARMVAWHTAHAVSLVFAGKLPKLGDYLEPKSTKLSPEELERRRLEHEEIKRLMMPERYGADGG